MKKYCFNKKIFLFLFILTGSLTFSQSDKSSDSKTNVPGNWGMKPSEKMVLRSSNVQSEIPDYLLEQYKLAKLNRDEAEKMRISGEISNYLKPASTSPESFYNHTVLSGEIPPPFISDWLGNDISIGIPEIAYAGGFRQLDLKYGEDGWLYLAVNRRNVSGCKGVISVFKSSNGGAVWSLVATVQNSGAYFGTISMLVEKRHPTLDDSVRIMVFYTRSANSDMSYAGLEVFSIKRNGTGFFANHFALPASGNKYEYPTACSNGMYWSYPTDLHVITREATNDGTQVGLRHFVSTDWGINFTSALINTALKDMYPSAAYSHNSGTDSIYIAVERRITDTESEIRVITTPEWASSNFNVHYITSAAENEKYEKPCITILQQYFNIPKQILITCTKDHMGKYHASTNGGLTWLVDYLLDYSRPVRNTWCSSDSLTAGGGYFMSCYSSLYGDSITVRRGIIGYLSTYLYKRNSQSAFAPIAPVCAIYKNQPDKWSSFAYAGAGAFNVYFDQESFESDNGNAGEIQPELPQKFELLQNFPNPFNPVTNISFSIPFRENVKLVIFDLLGNEASVLVNETMEPGSHTVSFNALNFSSGVYFYRLIAGSSSAVRRMVLIK